MKETINAIRAELANAEAKFPTFPEDPIHAAAVVVEEAGELQQAALQFTYEKGSYGAMYKEAIHTAAMALRFLLNLPNMRPVTSIQLRRVENGEVIRG